MFRLVRLDEAALIWADRSLGGAAAPHFHETLQTLIAEGARPILVDLVAVPSIDEGVVAVLAAAAEQMGSLGRGFELHLAGHRRFTIRSAAALRAAIAQGYPSAA